MPRSRAVVALAAALAATAALAPGAAVAAVAPAPRSTPTATVAVDPDPADRESMRRGYLEILEPAMQVPIGWTGDLATCDAGAPSSAALTATHTAINYFRDLVGVDPVLLDRTLSRKAQEAALMMARNGSLSHNPPSTWHCYSADGYEGARRSNLHLGYAGATAIAGYMVDPGAGNTAAGHRRWIMDPRQTRMGSGSVKVPGGSWNTTSDALYVLDSSSWQAVPADTPDFLPWPVAGYFPGQLEPNGRWSLSGKGAVDFSAATVTVDGSSNGITVHPVENGYGLNTLVWNFNPGFALGDDDRTYRVVVSNIRGAAVTSYAYDVTLFDAEAPVASPQTIDFTQPGDRTYGAPAGGLEATASSGLPVTFTSRTTEVCTTSGATVEVRSAGTCTIAANQAGDDSYHPAPEVQRSFLIDKLQLTVTAEDTTRAEGAANPDFEVSWAGFAYGQTKATSGVTGAPSCSSTATETSPPGEYPITCTTGTLVSGNYSFAFVPGTLTVTTGGTDTTPPVVTADGPPFRVRLGEFDYRWQVTDESGVDGIQERERFRTPGSGFGPWSSPADPSAWEQPGTVERDGPPPGETVCLSARGRDELGNVSDWSAPFCVHTPVDDTALTASAQWRTVQRAGAWNGSVSKTRKKGATLRLPGTVGIERVGILAHRCPRCGKVAIRVGRTSLGIVDLRGRAERKVILLPPLVGPVSGPVKVVVRSKGRTVQIDGVVATGWPVD